MKSTLTKRGLHVKASGYKVGVRSLAPASDSRVARGSSCIPASWVPVPSACG